MKLWVLIRKNLKLLTRQNWMFLGCLLSPIVLFLTMYVQQAMVDELVKRTNVKNPEIINVTGPTGLTQLKFGFTNGELDWTDFVVEDVKSKYKDLEILTYPELNQASFISKVSDGAKNNVAILFCTGEMQIGNDTVACLIPNSNATSFIYNILYNVSYQRELLWADFLQEEVFSVKTIIDSSIFAWASSLTKKQVPKLEVRIQSFPVLDRYAENYNVISTAGSTYLIITSFLLSALIIQEITKEKSEFLKVYLSLHEVSQMEYWLSWLLIGLLVSFMCAIEIPVIGRVLGFKEFFRIPILMQVFIFFLVNISGMLTGAVAAVAISDVKLGHTVSLSFIVVGLCIQFIACNQSVVKFLHTTDSFLWIEAVRTLFLAYPPFNFATFYFKIVNLAGVHYDYNENTWLDGKDIKWGDLFETQSGVLFKQHKYYIPAVFNNILYIIIYNIIAPLILTYLDHVLSDNRANTRPWNFIFKCDRHKDALIEPLIDAKLKLVSVHKAYNNTEVLTDVNLSINSKQILAVIGQNGAGKSTLLGILAGFIKPTSGSLKCSSKRFCPQKNVLWDMLTVQEHVELFANLNESNDYSILAEICLDKHKNVRASNLSGGMKRRLSLAISVLGDPDVVLLDEPTTGLDPVVRKQIWKFIEKLGKERIVVFTSHSMEEVQFLAEKTMFLQDGAVKDYCSLAELRLKHCVAYEFAVKLKENSSFAQDLIERFQIKVFVDGESIKFTFLKLDERLRDLLHFLEHSEDVEQWNITEDSLSNIFYSSSDKLIR